MTSVFSFIPRLLIAALARPKLVVLLSVLVVLLCAIGLKNFAVTADYRVFFSEDNPQLAAFEAQERLFYKSDTVVFGLDTGESGTVFSPDSLQATEWLSQQSKTIRYQQRIDSLTTYRYTDSPTPDELYTDPLVPDASALTATDITILQQRAASEPNINNRLFSPNGRVALVVVTVELPGQNRREEIPEVTMRAREIASDFHAKWPQFELHLFGMVPFNQSLSETTLRDLGMLFPISIAAMLLLLGLLLRGLRPMLITSVVILASVMVGLGLAFWCGLVLNTATAAAPIIILTLSIAHSVHLLTNFQQALGNQELKPIQALQHSLKVNWLPVSLTCLTTIIGFLSLNASEAPPFQELGNVVAIGIAASWWFSLLLLPALVQWFGAGAYRSPSITLVSRLGTWVVKRYRMLLLLMPMLFLPLLAMIPSNSLNDVIREWFGEDNPVRQGMEFSMEHLGGVESIHFTLDSGETDGTIQPAFMQEVETFTDWLQGHDHVVHVNSYTRLLKHIHQAMSDNNPAEYRLPESRSIARSLLSVTEMGQGEEKSLNAMLDLDKRRARITVTLGKVSSNDIKQVEQDALQWWTQRQSAAEKAELHPPIIHMEASGTSMMFAELGYRNIRSMLTGTVYALIGISLILIITFRSIKIGLVSLIPNLVPAGLGFGLWAVIDGEINIALATVMGMTLGIVVDDTIHFLSKYLMGRREKQLNAKAAVQHAFEQVGQALGVTTIVLVGGFLILAASDFAPMGDIGLLTALVITFALVADFLLLPAILIALDTDKTGPNNREKL